MGSDLRLALLGDPVDHSLSPVMHEAALKAKGIGGTYVGCKVDAAGMERIAAEMRRGEWDGANITMPHKHLAYRLADKVNDEAVRAGSVNTWLRIGAVIEGYSTDVVGIRAVWSALRDDGPVLILGSGGAASAAVIALENRELVISARSLDKGLAVIERSGVPARLVPWGTPMDGATVVNCTPLGMRGEALPAGVLSSAIGLLDMTYGPDPSPAILWANRAGIPYVDGIKLLAAQAEESFRIWTGRHPPVDLMETVARKHLSTPDM